MKRPPPKKTYKAKVSTLQCPVCTRKAHVKEWGLSRRDHHAQCPYCQKVTIPYDSIVRSYHKAEARKDATEFFKKLRKERGESQP